MPPKDRCDTPTNEQTADDCEHGTLNCDDDSTSASSSSSNDTPYMTFRRTQVLNSQQLVNLDNPELGARITEIDHRVVGLSEVIDIHASHSARLLDSVERTIECMHSMNERFERFERLVERLKADSARGDARFINGHATGGDDPVTGMPSIVEPYDVPPFPRTVNRFWELSNEQVASLCTAYGLTEDLCSTARVAREMLSWYCNIKRCDE
jgi:hypothetical protein